jgi:soluble lytic murein transglycosylase
MKTILLFLLFPTITLANDLNSPLLTKQCSKAKIIERLPPELKQRVYTIAKMVTIAAKKFNVNECVILSIVWTESTFKASQKSSKGASGLMQVMPRTAEAMRLKLSDDLKIAVTSNLHNGLTFWEVENLFIGTYYYSKLLKRYKGNRKKALIAYNMGPTFITNNYASDNHNYFKKVSTRFNLIAVND